MMTRCFWLMGALLATALLGSCARTADSPVQPTPTLPAKAAGGTLAPPTALATSTPDKHAGEGLIASIFVFLGGHTNGQYMFETQPMKFSAIEAHWETSAPASFSIITIGDLTGRQEVWSIRVPYLLSFLACNNFSCEVRGVNDLQAEYVENFGPGDYVPLMVVNYWAFRIMMTIGFFMMLVSAWFLFATRKSYENAKWMKWVPWVLVLPYLANMAGWILTEMGRQPWIVQGLLTVSKAVSPNLTTLDLLVSLIGYVVVYGSLAAAMFYLMRKYAIAGPDAAMHESVDADDSGIGEVLPVGAQD